jgi:hypothetical protein
LLIFRPKGDARGQLVGKLEREEEKARPTGMRGLIRFIIFGLVLPRYPDIFNDGHYHQEEKKGSEKNHYNFHSDGLMKSDTGGWQQKSRIIWPRS